MHQQLNAASGNVLVNAGVMKARRMTAPKEVSRRTSRRIYLPRAREKNGVGRSSEKLLSHHRSALRCLLAIFSEQQKWHNAAGVLSVLIGIAFEGLKSTALAGRWSDFSVCSFGHLRAVFAVLTVCY